MSPETFTILAEELEAVEEATVRAAGQSGGAR